MYDELLIGGSDGVPRLYKMHRETKRVIGDDANKVREYEAMPGRIYAAGVQRRRQPVRRRQQPRRHRRGARLPDGRRQAACRSSRARRAACYAVAFRPDGKQVASAGFDGIVRLNDPTTGKLIKEFVPVPRAEARPTAAK